MEPHLLFFIARAWSGRIADFYRSERNAMSEETNEMFKINRLSRCNFLSIGTTILAAAAGMAGLSTSAQSRWSAQKDECGHSASNPEPENKSLLNEDAKSSTPPPIDCSDVIDGLLC
jgi:hypothetical protein